MSYRSLEDVSGIGHIYDQGTLVGQARYSIHVSQRIHRAIGQEVAGLLHVEGVITPEGPHRIFSLMDRDSLTLVMPDGRRWDFAFTNSNGRAVNTGQGLYA